MAKSKDNKKPNIHDPSTWTSDSVRGWLRNATLTEPFFQFIFKWTEDDLKLAAAEADKALSRAGIDPGDPIYHAKDYWAKAIKKHNPPSRAARKYRRAEQSLRGHNSLFDLPHERRGKAVAAWFEDAMMLNGRDDNVRYDYPTIVHRFLPLGRKLQKHADLEAKRDAGKETAAVVKSSHSQKKPTAPSTPWHVADQQRPLPVDDEEASADFDGHDAKRRRLRVDEDAAARTDFTFDNDHEPQWDLDDNATAAPIDYPPNNPKHDNINIDEEPTLYHFPPHQLTNVELHIGWLTVQEDGTLIVEKGFRSLNTWLESANPLRYNNDIIKESLRIGWDSGLQIFWFDDYNLEPWVAADVHALAGAIDRMSRKADEVCLFVARSAGVVGSLPVEQRKLHNQTEQNVVLVPVAAGSPGCATKLVREQGESPDGPRTVRHGNKQYLVPGISVSLAKKLGEEVMKSRISYEYRDESGKNDSKHGGGGEVGKHGDDDGVDEEEEFVDEEEDYP